jgi:hypothetical protein
MTGVLLVESLRRGRPNVVIARREIKRKSAERLEDLLELTPLVFSSSVVRTLDGIAGAHDECRLLACDLLPHALVDARLSFARAVAEKNETDILRG